VTDDPFALLGLPRRADVTDDDVRAAWRRIAAATHPDRDDGGEPERFGAAAAAYAALRTAYERGEAIADLAADGGGSARRWRSGWRWRPGWRWRHATARRHGTARRTGVLAVRVPVAGVVAGLAFLVAGWVPSSIGVLAGVLTWLLVTTWRAVPWRRSR
jgi:hypothetical protein